MKLLLLLLCFGWSEGQVGGRFAYRIDRSMDQVLEEFRDQVKRTDDGAVVLEVPLAIGGYTVTAPVLRNMSTLERVGPAWLVPLDEEVEVHVNLTFADLNMDFYEIAGPGVPSLANIIPSIVVRYGYV